MGEVRGESLEVRTVDGWMDKVGRDRRGLGSGGVEGIGEVGEVVCFLRKLFGLNYTVPISI